jgi:hypothetical protein
VLHEFAHIWFMNLTEQQRRQLERSYGADAGVWTRAQIEAVVDDVVGGGGSGSNILLPLGDLKR